MKFSSDIHDKPFEINGTTEITFTIELGDIFIDKGNNILVIIDITDRVELMDFVDNRSFEALPLSKEFLSKHKFAGRVEDKDLLCYEDAISLCNS
ncbi:MAG: hypothetical protein AABY22_24150 [Nanoarchaeota archaeon]